MENDNATGKGWTHAAYQVADTGDGEAEAAMLRVGDAKLVDGNLVIDLRPGLTVSGRIILKLGDGHYG